MDLLDEVKRAMREALKDDEFFKLKAQMFRKMYEALIEEEFSFDAAITIVAHQQNAGG